MPRLLLVAYYFPPTGGAGSQRPAKFAKYLPSLGWKVTVVTPAATDVNGVWAPADATLEADVASVRIVRVATSHRGNWIDAAWIRIASLLEHDNYDAVLITMSPFTLAHLGLTIKKHVAIPVIFDLRDPWALDGWVTYRSRLHWNREYRFMKSALTQVDGIIMNTPDSLAAMRSIVPKVPEDAWTVIPNGYDAEDFVNSTFPKPSRSPDDVFRLVHTGSLHSRVLYRPNGLASRVKHSLHYRPEPILPHGRTLKYLLQAVFRLRREQHPHIAKLRITCAGVNDSATQRSINDSGCADQVEQRGYVSHSESVQLLQKATGLFLPLHGYTDPNRRSLIVPGKTYEYLASGVPILACLPPGDARDLVLRSGRGYCADPCDSSEIAAQLSRMLLDWSQHRTPPHQHYEWLHAYDRKELARALADFLTARSHIGHLAPC